MGLWTGPRFCNVAHRCHSRTKTSAKPNQPFSCFGGIGKAVVGRLPSARQKFLRSLHSMVSVAVSRLTVHFHLLPSFPYFLIWEFFHYTILKNWSFRFFFSFRVGTKRFELLDCGATEGTAIRRCYREDGRAQNSALNLMAFRP